LFIRNLITLLSMKTTRPAKALSAGFTMVEILVVISIIALLASLSIVAMGHATRTSNREKSKAYLKNIELLLDRYKNDNGTYPRPKEGSEGNTTSVGGIQYSMGGAVALYQALTGDGDDGMEGGDTSSMGKAGSMRDSIVYWPDADPNGSMRIAREAEGKYFIGDGFGAPFQYKVPPPVSAKNADNFETLQTEYKNPRTYDLWSYGGEYENPKAWITNW
jgi:prepilin-type N-terminal cleavage/methylation domain-containing protein